MHTTTDDTETNWAVSYDAEPIRIRDPVAEALAVLDPGDPFVITYEDVVQAAGHSCPTAAGAFRIAQRGLDALYPDSLPVRSDVAVVAAGTRDDPTYGVTATLLSYITGAGGVEGFGGLAGGYGGRQNLLTFDGFDADTAEPTFRLRRRDTDDRVEVVYHVDDVPDGGPAMGHLRRIVEGTASERERAAFAEAWHGRVQAILDDERLVTVEG
ncbi:hypothetical protein [Haloplanus aerogenes]|uniref:Formylmethanofuran dehydrogenase subunit E domain-containing protein n=1 Tax=Haloplanus aerogenes TaxID=660522 RepID=A0A3M0DWQ3_9EURY|nr:hypothetical protein [Haloplanus aerogenes]AZH24307.1 hypothetical protein DU502_02470 [Haloplanus aerogenes]RMB24059.1 hypothetical protein ATH50_1293 [Haloplanus aerogenes]